MAENNDWGVWGMAIRVITGVVGLPILIGLVAYGGIALLIAVLLVALIGMHEFYKAFSKNFKPIHLIGYVMAIYYIVFIDQITNVSNHFNIFVSLFLIVLLVYTVINHKNTLIVDSIITFFGYFYVCFLISHIFLIRNYTYGQYFVWLVFICAWGCDTGAYFTGVTLGKHKLIPDLSPKKTIEGSIGGIAVATIIAFIYGMFVEKYFVLSDVNTVLLCTVTGALGSILAQIGDLAASAMKRYTDIKDFGNLIPGHGGIIDRFDSVLLTAPVVYYIMFFLIKVK